MILNPVIQGGGAEEKEYMITDNVNAGFPKKATPGMFVYSAQMGPGVSWDVFTQDGKSVWFNFDGSAYAYSFIMPASDVIVR